MCARSCSTSLSDHSPDFVDGDRGDEDKTSIITCDALDFESSAGVSTYIDSLCRDRTAARTFCAKHRPEPPWDALLFDTSAGVSTWIDEACRDTKAAPPKAHRVATGLLRTDPALPCPSLLLLLVLRLLLLLLSSLLLLLLLR